MKVIFDSNVIIADRWLSSADFLAVSETRNRTSHELCVPALAIDEAVNDFAEHLAAAERDLKKAGEALTRLLHRSYEVGTVSRGQLVSEYKGALLDRLRRSGARILAYPKVSHDRVVRRALERRRPFDDKGHNGYRDVLMWHSVLAEMRGGERIAFVSNDRGFYSLPRDSRNEPETPAVKGIAAPSVMHPHLVPDLARRAGTLDLYYSLHDFVELAVNPLLVEAPVEGQVLKEEEYKNFDVRKAVREHLLEGFRFVSLDPAMLGMPPEVEHASVLSLEEVVRVEVAHARRVARDLVMDIVAECEVRVETYAWQEPPEPDSEVPALPTPSDEEFMDELFPRVLLRVEATMVVEPETWSIRSIEIQSVDPVQ